MRKQQIIIIVFFVVFIALIVVGNIAVSFNDHTYTCTVTDKDRVYSAASQRSYYLIYCKDDQGNYYEFMNSDNLFRLKFRSSTVYNKIEVGKTYKFTVVGYRIGILSSYENIIDFEEIQ